MQVVNQKMVTGANAQQLAERVNEYLEEGKWVVVPGTVSLCDIGCAAVVQQTPDMEMMQKMAQMRQQMAGPPTRPPARPAAPGQMGAGVTDEST